MKNHPELLLTILAIGLTFVLTTCSTAQDSLNISKIAALPYDWSFAYDVKTAGEFAYVADGSSGMRILDISDQDNPQQIAVFPTPGVATMVEISGEIVFLGGREISGPDSGGYYCVDVSNPFEPRAIAPLVAIDDLIDILIDDQRFLYIMKIMNNNFSWLSIEDVSDPFHPDFVFSHDVDGRPRDLIYENGVLYFITNQGLGVWDVSNPWRARQQFTFACSPAAFCVKNSIAYIACNQDSVLAIQFDLEIPQIGAYPLDYWYQVLRIDWVEGRLLVNHNWGGVEILDIDDPANITRVSNDHSSEDPQASFIQGNMIYYASGVWGLEMYEFDREADSLIYRGGYVDPNGISDVEIVDNHAFILSNIALHSIDLADPEDPVEIGLLRGYSDNYSNMIAANGLLYVGGVTIIDPSDPINLRRIGGINAGSAKAIRGDRMAVSGYDTIRIVDISIPERPAIIGTFATHYSSCLAWRGEYLASGNSGAINLYDASNPTDVEFLSSYATEWYCQSLASEDTLIFTGLRSRDYNDSHGAFQILNCADRYHMREVGFVDLPGEPLDIRLDEDRAVVAMGEAGFAVINIADPTNPEVVGFYDTPGSAKAVSFRNNIVCVADGNEFGIYDCREILTVPSINPPQIASFSLSPAFPNPFNSRASFRYDLRSTNSTNLLIFDPLGRLIADLTPQIIGKTGAGVVTWEAMGVTSGCYIARLASPDGFVEQPMIMVK